MAILKKRKRRREAVSVQYNFEKHKKNCLLRRIFSTASHHHMVLTTISGEDDGRNHEKSHKI